MRLPTASAGELADRLGVSIVDVQVTLRGLESKGLVGRLPGAVHRFQAAPPEQALGPLVRRRHRELRTMRADVGTLSDEYRSAPVHRDSAESIELVFGESALANQRIRLRASALAEVCALMTDVPPALGVPVPNIAHPGVRERVVYPRRILTRAGDRGWLADAITAGQRARVVTRPPINMLVIDRAVALVPVLGERLVRDGVDLDALDQCAVLVHPGGLQDALLALFESTWAVAAPLLVGADGQVYEDPKSGAPSTEDLRLLALLLEGLTDQAIAGKMGLGTRTVQRRVRDLIELTGVQTRLQLIWQATQRGWI